MTDKSFQPLVAMLHVIFKTVQHESISMPEQYLLEKMAEPEAYVQYIDVMQRLALHACVQLKKHPEITAQALLMAALRQDRTNPVYGALVDANEDYQHMLAVSTFSGLDNEAELHQKQIFTGKLFEPPQSLPGSDFNTLLEAAFATDEELKRQRIKKLAPPRFIPPPDDLPELNYDPMTVGLHLGFKIAAAEIANQPLDLAADLRDITGILKPRRSEVRLLKNLAIFYAGHLIDDPALKAYDLLLDTLRHTENSTSHLLLKEFQRQQMSELTIKIARGQQISSNYLEHKELPKLKREWNVASKLFDFPAPRISTDNFDDMYDTAIYIDTIFDGLDPTSRPQLPFNDFKGPA